MPFSILFVLLWTFLLEDKALGAAQISAQASGQRLGQSCRWTGKHKLIRIGSPATLPSSWTATGAGPKQQGKPRVFGHRNGVKSVREVTEAAAELGVPYLTLVRLLDGKLGPAPAGGQCADAAPRGDRLQGDLHADGEQHPAPGHWPISISSPKRRTGRCWKVLNAPSTTTG
jgi:hypothetical protein